MKSQAENNLTRIIRQSIKHFKLDLSGLAVLVPSLPPEPALAPLMAAFAGAKDVYMICDDLVTLNIASLVKNELNLDTEFHFVSEITPQVLSQVDCIIAGEDTPYIDAGVVSVLKKDCVITVLPQNLDFKETKGINLTDCAKRKIPVAMVNPSDHNLMLYKYFAHVISKRCYLAGLDIFRSKILLVGNGELLESSLSHLKTSGAHIYAAHTDRPQDQDYILKHLCEVDAIVVADYPQKAGLVIGNNGFIKTADILNCNSDVKIIHLSGKIDTSMLDIHRINYSPSMGCHSGLNINIAEMGMKAVCDITAACLKTVECLVKSKNRTMLPDEAELAYDIVNSDGPMVLGRITF